MINFKKYSFAAVFSVFVVILSPVLGTAQAPDFISPDTSGNSVKIVSILPDTSEPLYVGDTVEIEVEVEYEITQSPATITLNIQKGEMTDDMLDMVIASKGKIVIEEKGTIVIKQSIEVPETGSIQIFTPLLLEGKTTTATVDMRLYKVLKR